MVVVDTNVLAYLLLEGPQTAAARALFDVDPDWRSEPFILVEFANVLATTVRVRRLALGTAMVAYEDARRVLEPGLREAPARDVLTLADQFSISAYDARFIAVARALGGKLVTEDARLRKAAPRLTQSLADVLG